MTDHNRGSGRHLCLEAKMLYTVIAGTFIALLLYLSFTYVGEKLVDEIYLSPEKQIQRRAEIFSQLESYVHNNGISGKDTQSIARWTAEKDYVTILIYGPGSKHRSFCGGRAMSSEAAELLRWQDFSGLYPLRFSDGTYLVSILDNSAAGEDMVVKITALLLSVLIFTLSVLWYMGRMTSRIKALSCSAQKVSGGDLDRQIVSPGQDEISSLAHAMDDMRRSLIEQMGSESMAWQANAELLTAISHDIRTPMTSMIGYLGILNSSDYSDVERCRQFSARAYEKAMDLKYLTDELFKYFLVFGSSKLEMELEWLDGCLLSQQLFGEAEFSLTEEGFMVERSELVGACQVLADPPYLKRVIDNLLSNIRKYASKDAPIDLQSMLEAGSLHLSISNQIGSLPDRTESSRIGLRTCEKIMCHMGGSFSYSSEDEIFTACLSLPAKTDEAEDI